MGELDLMSEVLTNTVHVCETTITPCWLNAIWLLKFGKSYEPVVLNKYERQTKCHNRLIFHMLPLFSYIIGAYRAHHW